MSSLPPVIAEPTVSTMPTCQVPARRLHVQFWIMLAVPFIVFAGLFAGVTVYRYFGR